MRRKRSGFEWAEDTPVQGLCRGVSEEVKGSHVAGARSRARSGPEEAEGRTGQAFWIGRELEFH